MKDDDPSPASLSLVAGLALYDAVELAAPQAQLQLKWPNDLMLDGGKLAGILLERAGNRIVAGFGVNLVSAPDIEGRKTASLADQAQLAPQAFAPLLAGSFARLLSAWRMAEPSSLVMAWMQKAHPVGTALSVHGGDGEMISGSFAGLEEDGALRIDVGGGDVRIIRAGDVSLDSEAEAG